MSIRKSKARKLAEFLRNITAEAKLTTEAVQDDKVVTTGADLDSKSTDTTALVSAASVTSYVGDKLGDYVHGTHDINLTFTGDVTGHGTITDMSHTSFNLTLDAETLPNQSGYAGKFLTTDGTTASWATVDTSNGDTAYSWGDHAQAGYLTSETNDYVDSVSFSTSTGILRLGRTGSLSDLTVDLDGRYLQSYIDTTYNVSAVDVSGGKAVRLTGSDGTTDDVKFAAGSNVSLARSGDTITISSTDTNTDTNTTDWYVANSSGGNQFKVDKNENVRFEGTGATSVSFNASNNKITINSTDTNTETTTNLVDNGDNTITYTNEEGTAQTIDLSLYLDDTNLARILSGTMNSSGVATFTRDDDTTFTVDMSVLLDDTNLSRITSASWNTSNGVLTLTRNDNTTVAVDLDGRYVQKNADIVVANAGPKITLTDTTDSDDHRIAFSNSSTELHSINTIGSRLNIDSVQDIKVNRNGTKILDIVSSGLNVTGAVNATSFSGSLNYNDITNPPVIDNSVDYINGASFNTSTGVLTLSGVGRAGATVDLDNRYLTSYTETDTLQSVTSRGRTTTNNIRFTQDEGGIEWERNTDRASIKFYNDSDGDTNSRLEFNIADNTNEDFRFTYTTGTTITELLRMRPDGGNNGITFRGHTMWHAGNFNPSNYLLTSNYEDNYVDSVAFNTSSGVLTLGRTGSLPDLTIDLDGRYITSETDSQTLSWNGSNGQLSISGGNTVDLDGRYVHSDYINSGYDWNTFNYGSNEGVIARVESSAVNPPATGVYNWSLYQQGDSVRGSQIALSAYAGGNRMYFRGSNGASGWNGWDRVFADNYHPNADKWTTARSHTVTLIGQVTGSATQSVDGTGNKTWSIVTTLNDSALDDQYVTVGSRYTGNASNLLQNRKASVRLWDVSTATDDPTGAQDGLLYTAGWDSSSWGVQQYHDFHSNNYFIRNKYNGTWQGWDKVWTEGNDGPGSGLDADTLDGFDHTQFNPVAVRYHTPTNPGTGRIKIRLPFATNSARMLKFTISVYTGYHQHTYEVSGYLYSAINNWYSPVAIYSGSGTADIKVGRDTDGRAYVSVGSSSYTGAIVHSVTIGHTGTDTDAYNPNWTITDNADTPNTVSISIRNVLNTNNYSATLDSTYVRKSGDTMTGDLVLSSSSIRLPNSSSDGIRSNDNHRVIDCLGDTLRIGDTAKHNIIRMHGNGSDDFRVYYNSTDYKIWHEGNFNPNSYSTTSAADGRYVKKASLGLIGNSNVAFGSTAGWPNNPTAGFYKTDYVGYSGLVIMSGNVGGSTPSIGLEFAYNGQIFMHSNTDSSQWHSHKLFTDSYHPNADQWTTARRHTINLTGDVTGSAYQDVNGAGNRTWTINTVVANNSHTHDDRYVRKTGDTMTGSLTVPGVLKVTEAGTAQHFLIGNQDSGGVNKPAMIRGVNGQLQIGHGSSWSGEGGTMTVGLTVAGPKVGIGTTSPASTLHLQNVNGGAWNDGLIIDDPTGWAATIYRRSDDPKMFQGLYANSDNFIWMSPEYSNSGTTVSAPRNDAILQALPGTNTLEFYLPSYFGQNVGIGTTNPGAQLHVYKGGVGANTGVTDMLRLELNRSDHSTTPSGPAILFKDQDTNNTTNQARIKMMTVNDIDYGDNDEAASNFVFETTNGGVAADKMIITGRGDIGMGTNNPKAPLHVTGNVKVGTTNGSASSTIVSDLDRFLEVAVQDGSGSGQAANYTSGSGIVFHHGGTCTSAIKHLQPDASTSIFRFDSDRANTRLEIEDGNTRVLKGSSNALRVQTNSGYIDIGPMNTSHCHIATDRSNFYFDTEITVDSGIIGSYNEDLQLRRARNSAHQIRIAAGTTTISQNTVIQGNLTVSGSISQSDGFGTLYTFNTTQGLSTSWADVSAIAGNALPTGTYAIQIFVNNYDTSPSGGNYSEYYSGTMSWYGSSTNDNDWNEIPLHNAGHAQNGSSIFARTLRRFSGQGNLILQLAASGTVGSDGIQIKLRRLI